MRKERVRPCATNLEEGLIPAVPFLPRERELPAQAPDQPVEQCPLSGKAGIKTQMKVRVLKVTEAGRHTKGRKTDLTGAGGFLKQSEGSVEGAALQTLVP